MSRWMPESVWIERGEEDSALARRVRARIGTTPIHVVDDLSRAEPASDFRAGKRRLVLQRYRGTFLHNCPAGTPGMVCCNYLVLNFASNCPFDCSYCFLQDYLANNPAIKAYTNPGDGLREIDAIQRARPDRAFRIGTGELADSLALDHLTDVSCELVPFFAERPTALLELKTKSDCIDNLLGLDPKERVVVSWSVSPPALIDSDEPGTIPLAARAAAARRVVAAGYKVGFHFDPLIAHDGWEENYRSAIDTLFHRLDTGRVAWVSLGSLRMTARLKGIIRERPHPGAILATELVPNPDGKERVWRGLRVRMYRQMLGWLRDLDPDMPLYICMEPATVWERLFGIAPTDRALGQRLAGALS